MGGIYGKVIRNKIETQIQGGISEEHAMFTAGRSTNDHTYTIQQLLEKKKTKTEKYTRH